MSTWIETKRKKLKLSQTEVAASLGVSRPTYTKLEKGEVTPTEQQKVLLGQILGVSESTVSKQTEHTPLIPETIYPHEVREENVEKFKQVFLYCVSKVGNKPNIGQTALYKLLYFIDFDYYEKYQEYLTGATYIKNTYGPTPVSFAKIARELQSEKEGKLVEVTSKHFGYDQKRYMSTTEPDVSTLTARELKHIDDELTRLSSKSARELSDLSHIDTPWKVAKDRAVLNYRHVFYRPDETSVTLDND